MITTLGYVVLGLAGLASIAVIVGLASPAAVARLVPWVGRGGVAPEGSAPADGAASESEGSARAGASRSRAVAVTLPVAAVLVAAALVLLALPNYDAALVTAEPVVAGESTSITIEVCNAGLFGGTYAAEYALDGVKQSDVRISLAGRGSDVVELPVAADLEPGPHTATVGGHTIEFTALRPAAFSVDHFSVDADLVKIGRPVTVTADVSNTGEVAGDFPAQLRAAGKVVDEQPAVIGPGETETFGLEFRTRRPGTYRLSLGDASKKVVVVKPVRHPNGTYLVRSASGGRGLLEIKNGNKVDGVVVLARTTAPKKAVLAVYVRAKQSFSASGIPNGKYRIYYTLGKDWNAHTDGFLELTERGRFQGAANYSTSSWTSSWSDSSYRYTQQNVRYTRYTITLHGVAGGTADMLPVSEGEFPKL